MDLYFIGDSKNKIQKIPQIEHLWSTIRLRQQAPILESTASSSQSRLDPTTDKALLQSQFTLNFFGVLVYVCMYGDYVEKNTHIPMFTFVPTLNLTSDGFSSLQVSTLSDSPHVEVLSLCTQLAGVNMLWLIQLTTSEHNQ